MVPKTLYIHKFVNFVQKFNRFEKLQLMTMVNSIREMMSTVEAAPEAEIATPKKKTDLYHPCWPVSGATSKFWDSMPDKGNLSTTPSCGTACLLR